MQRADSRYHHTRRYSKQLKHVVLLGLILLIAFVPTFYSIHITHADELQIWFFDIGQGDATFIQTPEGKQILVDGGPDDRVLQKLGSVMWPWDRTLDAIVVTHPDADHITGLVNVLEQYEVREIIETGARGTTPVIRALDEVIEQEQAVHRIVKMGEVILFDGLTLHVVWPLQTYENEQPDDRNNTSIVLLAEYGQTSVLLTGDAEVESEVGMQSFLQDVDVLKAGHHGSSSSSTSAFLKQIQPEVTIISAGVDNRYGHPHPVVLDRLSQIGSKIFRTDLDGDILLTSSGEEPTIKPSPLPF